MQRFKYGFIISILCVLCFSGCGVSKIEEDVVINAEPEKIPIITTLETEETSIEVLPPEDIVIPSGRYKVSLYEKEYIFNDNGTGKIIGDNEEKDFTYLIESDQLTLKFIDSTDIITITTNEDKTIINLMYPTEILTLQKIKE
mgnify:CR=1 FL=1